ncbi:hypothetical protein [Defluviimonas sp. SAOS-178_SWC]|uniref:hypothetical protein n=1 Tax=Defluviimonas sp. SAOS-178_SWC TaxID=3121287 RepID=UPI0032214407
MTAAKPPAYPLFGLIAALAGLVGLEVLAFLRAGVFEYPLDDVYIHLAMASNIAHGTYGVNAGEAASAASSILYPFLLVPFPDTEFQRLLPLFWNALAVAGCGWVWGRIVAEAGLSGKLGTISAAAGPIYLNMSGVGYTGMEAAPHMLASLMIVLGLWQVMTGRGVAVWFVAAAIAAPLLRYEGLALALTTAVALALNRERRAGALIAVGAVGCVVAFSLFLIGLGLDPLPSSVLAKTAGLDPEGGIALRVVVGVLVNLSKPAGMIMAALLVASLGMFIAFPGLRRGATGWVLAVAWISAAGHLVLGQIGWMHRYEPYVLACLVGVLLLAATAVDGTRRGAMHTIALVAGLAAGLAYLPTLWGPYGWNTRAIYLQQAQMGRLVQDYLKVPVAVNDLGRVSWSNPNYVLDIWGLGSAEARKIRFGPVPPAPGWAGPLAAAHAVQAALIYDKWFASAVGPDWVRVGELRMENPRGALGDWVVALYATDPAYAPEMRAKLEEFAPTLPKDAILVLEPEVRV